VATNLEQELAQHLIRFKELDQHQSSFRPVDMALARFDRRRFSVIGRPSEATSDAKSLNSVEAFNMVYVQCDPGKGIGLHKHNTAEIFIPMTGMWEVGMGDEGESLVTLGPWDILNVPLNVMHSATNVSNAAAFLMVLVRIRGVRRFFGIRKSLPRSTMEVVMCLRRRSRKAISNSVKG